MTEYRVGADGLVDFHPSHDPELPTLRLQLVTRSQTMILCIACGNRWACDTTGTVIDDGVIDPWHPTTADAVATVGTCTAGDSDPILHPTPAGTVMCRACSHDRDCNATHVGPIAHGECGHCGRDVS